MDDREIIQLYIQKNENAIQETDRKYRPYLYKIAHNILGNAEDCEECLNDVFMAAWKSIHAGGPYHLKLYLARLTKNQALNMLRSRNTEKRGKGQYTQAVEELEEVLAAHDTPEEQLIQRANIQAIQSFLDGLPELECAIFVRRYWFADSIADIAERYDISQVNTKVKLHRTVKKLRAYLEAGEWT